MKHFQTLLMAVTLLILVFVFHMMISEPAYKLASGPYAYRYVWITHCIFTLGVWCAYSIGRSMAAKKYGLTIGLYMIVKIFTILPIIAWGITDQMTAYVYLYASLTVGIIGNIAYAWPHIITWCKTRKFYKIIMPAQ